MRLHCCWSLPPLFEMQPVKSNLSMRQQGRSAECGRANCLCRLSEEECFWPAALCHRLLLLLLQVCLD